jgi:hypothetical protein
MNAEWTIESRHFKLRAMLAALTAGSSDAHALES